jgi:alkaline phosphatase
MRRSPPAVLLTLLLALPAAAGEQADRWFAEGAAAAAQRIDGRPGRAKNLILFVGDGMGMTTISAARILAGQRAGGLGEDHQLSFERLPHTALAKTYSVSDQTADSAPTMSAMMTGAKLRRLMVSVGPDAATGDCASASGQSLLTLLELAEIAGMATGVVTNTRITHATPAAGYAHSAHREWESDADLPEAAAAAGCRDIARQLIEFPFGDGIDVALGGGRSRFLPTAAVDPEYPELRGRRRDGRDLLAEWSAGGADRQYVWNRAQFDAIDPATTGQLLGLFEPEHLRYERDRAADPAGEPSLAELVGRALDLLERRRDGYVLIVEGGLIDRAHHEGSAQRALDETVMFAEAVQVALTRSDPRQTLLVVTADHSHTLGFAGYPSRGNPILGLVRARGQLQRDLHGRPYTTLSYANGPGHRPAPPQLDDASVDDADFLHEALRPLASETHGGEDVPVYARGPGAAAVRGVFEQNVLYHLMVQNSPRLRRTQCRLAGGCRVTSALGTRPDHEAVLRAHGKQTGDPQ